jgi:hypothetical protein
VPAVRPVHETVRSEDRGMLEVPARQRSDRPLGVCGKPWREVGKLRNRTYVPIGRWLRHYPGPRTLPCAATNPAPPEQSACLQMPPQPKRDTPRETRSAQARRLAEGSFKWTKLGAIFGAVAIVVAIVIAVVTISQSGSSQPSGPVGVAVNTVPRDQIGGAAIYPIPGGQPSDYLSGGVTLYVDCLQPVKPKYLLARISDGPYANHWIDVFDIKTPEGNDVRFLKPALRICGPAVALASGSATAP